MFLLSFSSKPFLAAIHCLCFDRMSNNYNSRKIPAKISFTESYAVSNFHDFCRVIVHFYSPLPTNFSFLPFYYTVHVLMELVLESNNYIARKIPAETSSEWSFAVSNVRLHQILMILSQPNTTHVSYLYCRARKTLNLKLLKTNQF